MVAVVVALELAIGTPFVRAGGSEEGKKVPERVLNLQRYAPDLLVNLWPTFDLPIHHVLHFGVQGKRNSGGVKGTEEPAMMKISRMGSSVGFNPRPREGAMKDPSRFR